MDIQLQRASVDDAGRIQAILKESFMGLLEKYQDHHTNPAAMTVEAVRLRLEQADRKGPLACTSSTPRASYPRQAA